MELIVHDGPGQRWAEGPPGQPLMQRVQDVGGVLGLCFGDRITRLLLYTENLTERFFDLSSGDAGEILQKLRNYGIRLAIVYPPTLQLSQRFRELLIDERRGPYFRMFETRAAAEEWLTSE
ncbi:MAG TPA: DUF4180 domain-containing protein [Herpetosiphonaceae bacterium]